MKPNPHRCSRLWTALSRAPWLSAACAVLLALQYRYGWDWSHGGWQRGTDSWKSAATAVFAHHDRSHLTNNLSGVLILFPLAELGFGRRFLLLGYVTAVLQMVLFTGTYVEVRGISGMISFISAILLVGVVDLVRAYRDGHYHTGRQRARAVGGAVALIGGVMGLYIDLRHLGADDGVAHDAHLINQAAGTACAVLILVWTALRQRRSQTTSTHCATGTDPTTVDTRQQAGLSVQPG